MNRQEIMRREQLRRARRGRGGIPGWLWRFVAGGTGAFVVAVVMLRPTPTPQAGTSTPERPEEHPIQAQTRASERDSRRAEQDAQYRQAMHDGVARMSSELAVLRRRERDASRRNDDRAPTGNERTDSHPNILEQMAEKEREWRSVFAGYQQRYDETKRKHEKRLTELKRFASACGRSYIPTYGPGLEDVKELVETVISDSWSFPDLRP